MIRIITPLKYGNCWSCGRTAQELLRSFEIGHGENTKTIVTLCTECLGELEKQAILYQPKEEQPDEMDRELYLRRI